MYNIILKPVFSYSKSLVYTASMKSVKDETTGKSFHDYLDGDSMGKKAL